MQFKTKTEQFEGPLNLLLELIEKKQLDVTQISLAEVADDFLAFIEENKNITLANLSEFLLISSQLILLKSRALLPLFQFTAEEEDEIQDLQARLLEYKKFKKASFKLKDLWSRDRKCFSREEARFVPSAVFCEKIEPKNLKAIFEKIIFQEPAEEILDQEILEEVISLEEKMEELHQSILRRTRMAFCETIAQSKDKIEVVVTFLAMLEMIKQKIVSVKQDELFGEIILERR